MDAESAKESGGQTSDSRRSRAVAGREMLMSGSVAVETKVS